MAIFHLSARIISRSKNQTAVGKAAYNARVRLRDERSGEIKNHSKTPGLVFSGIFAPAGAPDWVKDRERLWNAVEKSEKRKDSQLAREIIVALPHELDDGQRKWLITDFVREQFMRKGMVADVNIHEPGNEGDMRNYHAHILLTMRSVGPEGFGKKMREWNRIDYIEKWRAAWENIQNRYLARMAPGVKVDRRTLAAQEITSRVPGRHLGLKGAAKQRDEEKKKQVKGAFTEQGAKLVKRRFTPHQLKRRKTANQNMPQASPARPPAPGRRGKKKTPEA